MKRRRGNGERKQKHQTHTWETIQLSLSYSLPIITTIWSLSLSLSLSLSPSPPSSLQPNNPSFSQVLLFPLSPQFEADSFISNVRQNSDNGDNILASALCLCLSVPHGILLLELDRSLLVAKRKGYQIMPIRYMSSSMRERVIEPKQTHNHTSSNTLHVVQISSKIITSFSPHLILPETAPFTLRVSFRPSLLLSFFFWD